MRNCLFAGLLLLFVCYPACPSDDSASDGDTDPTEYNWVIDGCDMVLNGFNVSAFSLKAAGGSGDFAVPELPPDCELPDNVFAAMAQAYLGDYLDDAGAQVAITSRPEGTWTAPHPVEDAECAYYWGFPVWIFLSAQNGTVAGNIDLAWGPSDADPLSKSTELYFELGDVFYNASRITSDQGKVQWYFTYPDEGRLWTKVN